MNETGIEPFYFGSPTKPLFGCYHTPQPEPSRDCGVVLCYPMGHEYFASHRAYHQLAVRLSHAGFYVLRFDFFGCGDSGGDCNQGKIIQWLTDVSTAIGAIRRRCGVEKVCLVGLRLGATLAMMTAVEQRDIAGLILWDPIVRGRIYIDELTSLHQEMLRHFYPKPKRHTKNRRHTEIMGYPLTDSMLTDIENLDLFAIRQKPANNILLIETDVEDDGERFEEHLKNMDIHLAYQRFNNPKMWMEDVNKVMVPIQILQSVVFWMSRMYK